MVQGIFKIVLLLRDLHGFMWQSLEISNVFNTLTLNQIFWKINTFIEKLEYRFLFESTENEIATFPSKTALPEGNVETNRMGIIRWSYHKERSFASYYFEVGLSPSKKVFVLCLIESPLKMMKNAFYFILKAFFGPNIFKYLSPLFGHVGKTAWLEREG